MISQTPASPKPIYLKLQIILTNTMKQKVVIKVTMCCPQKSRTKAMKIAATCDGVEAVALKGEEKNEIEVIGDGIDTVELAKLLRKYVGRADFVSVGPFKEEKKAEKKEEKKEEKKNNCICPPIYYYGYNNCPPNYYYGGAPCYQFYEPCHEPSCSIM